MCSNHLANDGKYFTAKDKQKALLKEVEIFPSQISAGNAYQNALNSNATTQTETLAKIEQAIKYGALLGEGCMSHTEFYA